MRDSKHAFSYTNIPFIKLHEIHHLILELPKYKEYFKDCVRALDGTHIAVWVLANQAPLYQNRKSYISQNVLAVYDFNMEFTYVFTGWERSAHDS